MRRRGSNSAYGAACGSHALPFCGDAGDFSDLYVSDIPGRRCADRDASSARNSLFDSGVSVIRNACRYDVKCSMMRVPDVTIRSVIQTMGVERWA